VHISQELSITYLQKSKVVFRFFFAFIAKCKSFVNAELAILLGILLLFYGANFIFTFTAFEAFRRYGWQQTKKHILGIWKAIQRAQDALKKDEPIEEDISENILGAISDATGKVHDTLHTKIIEESGTTEEVLVTSGLSMKAEDAADVSKEIATEFYTQTIQSRLSKSNNERVKTASARLIRLLKVVEPQEVSASVAGIVSAVLGVIATLTVTIAQAITIGASLGDTFYGLVEIYIKPFVIQVVPPPFKKWAPPLVAYLFKLVGITIAFFFAKWVMTLTICTKGGELILSGFKAASERNGYPLKEEQISKIGQYLFFGFFIWST